MSTLVTVLMPTFNAAEFLETSIRSILKQTLYDFEFLIINDGSKDNSEEIILSFSDNRIKYIKNIRNIGLANTLNKGLALAKGEYIIRMDADDYSLDTRIEKQVLFLNNNPCVGLCGTYFTGFGDYFTKYEYPQDYDSIKISLLDKNVIGHPTVIMRKSFFQKHKLQYDKNYLYCEDYELWTRAVKYFNVTNLAEHLLFHRKHENQISTKFKYLQKQNALKVKLNQLNYIQCNLNCHEMNIYKQFIQGTQNINYCDIINIVNKITLANKKTCFYNSHNLDNYLYNKVNLIYHE